MEDNKMSKKMNPMHKSLVAKVRKVNREAANWIRYEAPKMKSFVPSTDELILSFIWSYSPQGYEYWNGIFKKIGGIWCPI